MGRKVFALFVAGLFLYTASPLLLPVLMGGILAVLFIPLLEGLENLKRPFRIPTFVAAALLTNLISIVVLVPIAGLIFFGAKSGFHQLQAFRSHPAVSQGEVALGGDWIDALMDTPRVHVVLVWVARYFPATVTSLTDSAHDVVQTIVSKLGDWLGQFVSALPGLLLGLAVTTVSLFFFLIDGRNLVLFFRRNTLFTAAQTEKMIHALAGMCRSVMLASVVSGVIQSVIMLTAGLFLDLPNTPLVAGLVLLGSFIPVVGSLPITAGAVLEQYFMVSTSHGVAMLVVAILIVAADNVIRPWFLRGSANLHPLVAFVAAFGGLQTFGFMGVFLGPIIAGLFLATVQILVEDSSVPKHLA
jgi:predicted PurR-regulated permease PerM